MRHILLLTAVSLSLALRAGGRAPPPPSLPASGRSFHLQHKPRGKEVLELATEKANIVGIDGSDAIEGRVRAQASEAEGGGQERPTPLLPQRRASKGSWKSLNKLRTLRRLQEQRRAERDQRPPQRRGQSDWTGVDTGLNLDVPSPLPPPLRLATRSQTSSKRDVLQALRLGVVLAAAEGGRRDLVFPKSSAAQAISSTTVGVLDWKGGGETEAAGGPTPVSSSDQNLGLGTGVGSAVPGPNSAAGASRQIQRKAKLREYQGDDEVPRLFPKAAAQEECLGGWKYNWRKTGEGAICVEPDGCVWRKLDTTIKDSKEYNQATEMYSPEFVHYLSRFLIRYEQTRGLGYWQYKQNAMDATLNREEKNEHMQKVLAEYAVSVQYGLSAFVDSKGPSRLLRRLIKLYGETPEARKQILLMFSLLPPRVQPVTLMEAELLDVKDLASPPLKDIDLSSDTQELLDNANLPWLFHSATPLNYTAKDAYFIPKAYVPPSHQFLLQEPKEKAVVPVTRERRLNAAIYAMFAIAGLVGCTTTHSLLVPLDVVKTRSQTNPSMYPGLVQGVQKIYKEEGLDALLLGVGPTFVGYSWYGLTVYPGYELLKRELISLAGEVYGDQLHVPLVLLAGALATMVACIGVTPAETARIRIVAQPGYADSFPGLVRRIAMEEGIGSLFRGFGPLAIRQVLFGMMKFFIFDSFADEVFRRFPSLGDSTQSQLFVSLLAGAVAGLAASVVSQPADTILSKMKQEGSISFSQAVSKLIKEFGLAGLFLGLPERCLWATPIIAGQFFMYDVLKNTLQVASDDLNLFFDVLSTPADFIITHY